MKMKEFQKYIEENLPDRFRQMRMFRIPVKCNGIMYWAKFNNGVWEFDQASPDANPIITYVGLDITESEPDKVSTYEDEKDDDFEEDVKSKTKDKKAKSVREQKKPTKEQKKPVREQRKPAGVVVDDFDGDTVGEYPIDDKVSFVESKPIKKLTGRFALALILFILSLGTTCLTTIPVMYNCSKAKKYLNNPVEYWHYRSKTTYFHVFHVLTLIIGIIAVVALILTGGLALILAGGLF